MAAVVIRLPERAIKQFTTAAKAVAKKWDPLVGPPCREPAIGFTLNEQWILEVVFSRVEPGFYCPQEESLPEAAWWAFRLVYPTSQHTEPPNPGECSFHWPRLTQAETADLVRRLQNVE